MKSSIIFCFFAAFGGWVFGYDIGYISGCLIMPDFIQHMGEQDPTTGEWILSSQRQSIITSLLSAGTFFGALLQSFTSDRLGRRGSIIFWSTLFSVGIIIQVASFGLAQITVGRFVAGLGVGALSAIVPLYVGEAAPKKLRGALLVLYQVQIASGLFLAYIVDLGTHHLKSSASWRIPVGLQLVWGAFLIVGGLLLPESPRLLLGRGDEKGALKAIARLNDCEVDDALTRDVIKDLEEAIREENEGGKAGWLECFSTRSMMWKRTLNGCMIQFLQQLNGQNFYYYYGPVFFESADVPLSAYSIQAILGGISLATVIPAMWTIEHLGRRKSLLFGAAIQAACALIAGLVGHYYTDVAGVTDSMVKTGGNVLIAFAVIHVSMYSLFWGPTPWVILGETYPLRVRPKAIALAAAVNWLWNFLLSYFSPLIADDIGPLILLIFFGCLIFAFVYVFFMLPETRGVRYKLLSLPTKKNAPSPTNLTYVPCRLPSKKSMSSTDPKYPHGSLIAGNLHPITRLSTLLKEKVENQLSCLLPLRSLARLMRGSLRMNTWKMRLRLRLGLGEKRKPGKRVLYKSTWRV
ncbi:high-affinity glucose transporter SNF3 [Cryptococcus neoformans Bt120]|nr:high-affinity glucose transporter SNF3 [Cryptococcus neoformans var. grubii Bt15]OXG33256.1 high-affinity glucose transporter SNF3 [Cryptococcus neoformans var. grubii Bt120]